MTKDEFIKRSKATQGMTFGTAPLERQGCLVLTLAFVGPLVVLVGAALITYWIVSEVNITLFFVLYCVISWLWGNWFNRWYSERQYRNAALVCPSCNVVLRDYMGAIAIATGTCGSCGHPVFDDQGGQKGVGVESKTAQAEQSATADRPRD
jgi:hypothetical protein